MSDGSFRITIDGTAYNVDAIDFTTLGGGDAMSDCATIIQTALRAATSGTETVAWSTDHFVITSAITTSTSQVSVATTSTGTVGTDVSGEATAWMDCESGQGTAIPAGVNVDAAENTHPLCDATGKVSPGLGGVPAGAMSIWTTDTAPLGHLLCYGQAVSRTTYADLFAVISTDFGVGDSTNTFNVPDMRGRFPLGQDNMGGTSANRVTASEADTVGSSEGAETKDISHTHTIAAKATGTATAGANYPPEHTTDSGGSATQNVMNPYLTLNYIIKT